MKCVLYSPLAPHVCSAWKGDRLASCFTHTHTLDPDVSFPWMNSKGGRDVRHGHARCGRIGQAWGHGAACCCPRSTLWEWDQGRSHETFMTFLSNMEGVFCVMLFVLSIRSVLAKKRREQLFTGLLYQWSCRDNCRCMVWFGLDYLTSRSALS